MTPPAHRLLFVCSGNICRSPMAEAWARTLGPAHGRTVEARSGGTLDIRGRAADPLAVRVMGECGVDLAAHRSQGLDAALVDWAHHIFVMELRHQAWLREHLPSCQDRVLLLGPFGGVGEVPDPLGGWRWRFRRSRDLIRRCVDTALAQLPPSIG